MSKLGPVGKEALELARKVAREKQFRQGLDAYSASAILRVYEALSADNKKRFETLPLQAMAKISFQVIRRAS